MQLDHRWKNLNFRTKHLLLGKETARSNSRSEEPLAPLSVLLPRILVWPTWMWIWSSSWPCSLLSTSPAPSSRTGKSPSSQARCTNSKAGDTEATPRSIAEECVCRAWLLVTSGARQAPTGKLSWAPQRAQGPRGNACMHGARSWPPVVFHRHSGGHSQEQPSTCGAKGERVRSLTPCHQWDLVDTQCRKLHWVDTPGHMGEEAQGTQQVSIWELPGVHPTCC